MTGCTTCFTCRKKLFLCSDFNNLYMTLCFKFLVGNKSASHILPEPKQSFVSSHFFRRQIQFKMDQRVLAVFVFIILVICVKCFYWLCKISRVANFFRGIFSSYRSRCRRSLRRSRRIHPQENFVCLTFVFGD